MRRQIYESEAYSDTVLEIHLSCSDRLNSDAWVEHQHEFSPAFLKDQKGHEQNFDHDWKCFVTWSAAETGGKQ